MTRPLAPYPSPEERAEELDQLTALAGGRVELYGHSREGRALRAAVLPAASAGLPRVLCCANIHGPEYVGNRVATGLLEYLREPTGLRERAEVWVVPCVNPDGYARTWEAEGRGPLATLRKNAAGVDLNRNYPRPGGAAASRLPFTGSDEPGQATYRGPDPLSEPETAALDGLMGRADFHASANLHSFMGTLIPARVTRRDHYATYGALCAAFRRAQPHHRYRRLSSRVFDTFTGEQEDHQHHTHRTWALCVESFPVLASFRQHLRAPSTFWRFNPHDPGPWVENDVPGLLAFFEAALDEKRPQA